MLKLVGDSAALGSTPQGRAWVIGALHPSHNDEIRPRGIPDEEASSTVHLVYKMRKVLAPPVVEGKTILTWDCRLINQCNPIAPLCYQLNGYCTDGSVVSQVLTTVYNRQAMGVDPTSADVACLSWLARVSRWRPTKSSVTGQLDAPLTASQGTWMAANVPQLVNIGTICDGTGESMGAACACYATQTFQPDAAVIRSQVGYAHGVMAPGEQGGFYLIQNLDPVVDSWVGETNRCMLSSVYPTDALPQADFPYPFKNGVDDNGDVVSGIQGPTYQLQSTAAKAAAAGARTAGPLFGTLGFPNNNRWVSHAIVSGMSGEARLVLDIVQGWECVVRPGAEFAQFASTSPPYDPLALAAYHEIRRRLLDAYPAAYNDWDKLWGVIKGISRAVLPFLGALGPIGAGLALAGGTAVELIDRHVATRAKTKGKSQPLVKAPSSTMVTRTGTSQRRT